jgi:hypothetical protein
MVNIEQSTVILSKLLDDFVGNIASENQILAEAVGYLHHILDTTLATGK